MNKILDIYGKYKNGFYILIACLGVTLASNVFTKGEYYHYAKEKQIINDCQNGWLDKNDKDCIALEEKIKASEEEDDTSKNIIKIPQKSLYDYAISLSAILQMAFIGIMGFLIGNNYKSEKALQMWKCWLVFSLSILLEFIANTLYVFTNNIFSTTDFLRMFFEVMVLITMIVLGRNIK